MQRITKALTKTVFPFVKEELEWMKAEISSPWLYGLMAVALLWLLAAGRFEAWNGNEGWALAGLALGLIWMSLIDARRMMLPALLNTVLLLAGLMVAPTVLHAGVGNTVLGVLLAGGGLALAGWLTYKLTGKESLGGGDLQLVAALGAWVGALGLPMFLLMLALCGLLFVAVRMVGGKQGMFAFGPLLALAGWVAVLHQSVYWHVLLGV
jgi:leader peptidase (prepilin peptidase)/N-methyltransferase